MQNGYTMFEEIKDLETFEKLPFVSVIATQESYDIMVESGEIKDAADFESKFGYKLTVVDNFSDAQQLVIERKQHGEESLVIDK